MVGEALAEVAGMGDVFNMVWSASSRLMPTRRERGEEVEGEWVVSDDGDWCSLSAVA